MAHDCSKGCVKGFPGGERVLHCPDYKENVQLRRQPNNKAAAVTTEKDNV
jgi:hypothetical protein